MIVWLDGALIPEQSAAISIHDPGFLSADGVFETALLHDGGFFRLREHLERFAASAATLRIPAPPAAVVDGTIRSVIRANALRDAGIRITLTRGVDHPVLLVTARPVDASRTASARRGWRVITARTRRPSTASAPAQLKAIGRTYAILARHEATDAGVDDVLLLTDAGHICEGPTWNVFWRTGDMLFTPALEAGVLAGVTRSTLLELAPALGLATREGLFDRHALDDADEIFASMTSVGLVPFRSLDGRDLPAATPTVDALHAAYRDRVREEAALDPC